MIDLICWFVRPRQLAGRRVCDFVGGSIFDGPQRLVMQMSWLKAMLASNKRADIEMVDSTVICLFDAAAGEFWRAVQCVAEAAERESKFLPKDGESMDLSKGNLKDLAMYCVQLQTVDAQEMRRLSLGDVAGKQVAARGHLKAAFDSLSKEIATVREYLHRPFTNFRDIRAAVQEWKEDQIRRLLPVAADEAGAARNTLQEMIDSFLSEFVCGAP